MKKYNGIKKFAVGLLLAASTIVNAGVIDFENVPFDGNWMATPSDDGLHDWRSGNANLYFTSGWGGYFWEGFKASRAVDPTNKTYTNDCCSVMGGGAGGSEGYAVLYGYTTDFNYTTNYEILFDEAVFLESIDITNTAYAWNSFANGDGFADPISKAVGEAYQSLFIRGVTLDGYTDYVEIKLASKNAAGEVFILSTWETFSLSAINSTDGVYGLDMYIGCSENMAGQYGMNSPSYVAMDNISYAAVPEPSTYAAIFAIFAMGFVAYKRRQK